MIMMIVTVMIVTVMIVMAVIKLDLHLYKGEKFLQSFATSFQEQLLILKISDQDDNDAKMKIMITQECPGL